MRVLDPLEWRNDRRVRLDLWEICKRDSDLAAVALATYEAQRERQPKPEREGRDDR